MAVVFLGHEISFGVALAAWLLWGGAGALHRSASAPSFRRKPESRTMDWTPAFAGVTSTATVGSMLGALALAAPASVILIRLSKLIIPPGNLPGLFFTLVLPFVALAAPCWLVGRIFAEGAALRPAGRLYFCESLGAFTGGLVATWLYRMNPSPLIILSGGGAALVLIAVIASPPTVWRAWRSQTFEKRAEIASSPPRKPWRVLAMTAFASLILFVLSFPLERSTRALQFQRYPLLAQRETPYEHAAVTRLGHLQILFEDGIVSTQFPDPAAQEEAVQWPLLVHPAPRRVLALGVPAAVALPEILKHPVRSVDVVHADAAILNLLRPFLDRRAQSAWNDVRVHRFTADPRIWVRQHPNAYDVIIQTSPDPQNAALNRLFTREFFRQARAALRHGGILSFTLASSENYLPPEVAYTNAVELASVGEAFAHLEAIPGSRLIVLASDRPLVLDPAELARRYQERRLHNQALIPANLPFLLVPERRTALRLRLAEVRHVLPNTDLWPVSTFLTWRVWLSKFVEPTHLLGLAAAILLLAGALHRLWNRRRQWLATPASWILGAMGFAGMSLEIVLLFVFQSVSGALYWQMGTLMGAFMVGLSIGSGILSASRPMQRSFLLLSMTALLLAAICGAIAVQLPHFFAVSHPLAVFAALLATTGILVGAAFPLAVRLHPEMAASMYTADLWGSALGAFTAGAFLAPLVGHAATLFVSATAVLISLASVLQKLRS
jgi:spermidine synthase